MRVLERGAIAFGTLILVALPTALHGWPTTLRANLFTFVVLGAGLALMWWRTHPRAAPVVALGLLLLALAIGSDWVPETAVAIYSLSFAVLALGWSGRAAWLMALCAAAYLVPLYILSEETSWVALLMFTVPPYAAGTVLRLRRETADRLAMRIEELEEERELFTEIALRHERARIASELHDIVGHAISVMVIQAAAGQRLVDSDPARAKKAFAAISEFARQGTEDLQRLIELLDGGADDVAGGPDLSLVDEVVTRAARSGLNVSCRFEGDRDRVATPVAHLAFRVVQESLTNALRYAAGANVRILFRVDEAGRGRLFGSYRPAALVGPPRIELASETLDALAESDQAAPGPDESRLTRWRAVVLNAYGKTTVGLVDTNHDVNLRTRCVAERIGEALLHHAEGQARAGAGTRSRSPSKRQVTLSPLRAARVTTSSTGRGRAHPRRSPGRPREARPAARGPGCPVGRTPRSQRTRPWLAQGRRQPVVARRLPGSPSR